MSGFGKNPSREPNVLWCGDAAHNAFRLLASEQAIYPDEDYSKDSYAKMVIVHKFGMEGMMAGWDINYKKA